MRIPGANVGLLAHNTCSLVKIGLSDNLYQFFLHEIVQGCENVEEYGNNCTTMIGDIKTPGEAKNSGR